MATAKPKKKVRFILSRDMTKDQVIATIRKACREAGVEYEEDDTEETKSE